MAGEALPGSETPGALANMNVKEKVLRDLRCALDLILTDCYRYMKNRHSDFFKRSCMICKLRTSSGGLKGEPCGFSFKEELRLLSCLRGFGITNRYHLTGTNQKFLRNKYGRIIYYKGHLLKGRVIDAAKL